MNELSAFIHEAPQSRFIISNVEYGFELATTTTPLATSNPPPPLPLFISNPLWVLRTLLDHIISQKELKLLDDAKCPTLIPCWPALSRMV